MSKTVLYNNAATAIETVLKGANNKPNMKILEDLFGRNHNYLRVSLTERCNLRCKLFYSLFLFSKN